MKKVILLFVLLMLTACTAEPTPTPIPTLPQPTLEMEIPTEKVWPATVAELPAGDITRGEEFYTTKGCTACHGDINDESSAIVGPWLGNYAERAADRREGYTADSYLYESVLNPNAHIAPECPPNRDCPTPSMMPSNQSVVLEIQELADIMAYILQKESFEGSTEIEQLK